MATMARQFTFWPCQNAKCKMLAKNSQGWEKSPILLLGAERKQPMTWLHNWLPVIQKKATLGWSSDKYRCLPACCCVIRPLVLANNGPTGFLLSRLCVCYAVAAFKELHNIIVCASKIIWLQWFLIPLIVWYKIVLFCTDKHRKPQVLWGLPQLSSSCLSSYLRHFRRSELH